jgi:hypothetical protein
MNGGTDGRITLVRRTPFPANESRKALAEPGRSAGSFSSRAPIASQTAFGTGDEAGKSFLAGAVRCERASSTGSPEKSGRPVRIS